MTQATILAFAGSIRKESWNRKVLNIAVRGAEDAGADFREAPIKNPSSQTGCQNMPVVG